MSKRDYAVDISTVEVGDHISVAWKAQGVARVAVGKVGEIAYGGTNRSLISDEGGLIAMFDTRNPSTHICSMLERYTPAGPALFDLED